MKKLLILAVMSVVLLVACDKGAKNTQQAEDQVETEASLDSAQEEIVINYVLVEANRSDKNGRYYEIPDMSLSFVLAPEYAGYNVFRSGGGSGYGSVVIYKGDDASEIPIGDGAGGLISLSFQGGLKLADLVNTMQAYELIVENEKVAVGLESYQYFKTKVSDIANMNYYFRESPEGIYQFMASDKEGYGDVLVQVMETMEFTSAFIGGEIEEDFGDKKIEPVNLDAKGAHYEISDLGLSFNIPAKYKKYKVFQSFNGWLTVYPSENREDIPVGDGGDGLINLHFEEDRTFDLLFEIFAEFEQDVAGKDVVIGNTKYRTFLIPSFGSSEIRNYFARVADGFYWFSAVEVTSDGENSEYIDVLKEIMGSLEIM
ncbi:MAG: hypothetical protein AAB373_01280 [Patescibacteria group bacterium]